MGLLSLGLGAAGMIAGSIGSAIYNKKANKAIDRQAKDNKDFFDAQYYSDYTKRSDVQSTLGRMRDQMSANQARNRNVAAVTGATPEAAIASQAADNDALGKTMQGIAGQAADFKEGVQDRYQAQKTDLENKKIDGLKQQSANFANMGGNASSSILGAFADKKEEV